MILIIPKAKLFFSKGSLPNDFVKISVNSSLVAQNSMDIKPLIKFPQKMMSHLYMFGPFMMNMILSDAYGTNVVTIYRYASYFNIKVSQLLLYPKQLRET